MIFVGNTKIEKGKTVQKFQYKLCPKCKRLCCSGSFLDAKNTSMAKGTTLLE